MLAATNPVVTWLPLTLGVIGGVLGAASFVVSTRSRRAEDVERFLRYFQSQDFFVRLWRMDQVTRGSTGDLWSVDPVELGSLQEDRRPVIRQLSLEIVSSDWNSTRADMLEVYFFALRLAAWRKRTIRYGRTRRLNEAFGYQLVNALLCHQLLACRLRSPGRQESYFPSAYGVLDRTYQRLTQRLVEDIVVHGELRSDLKDELEQRWKAIRERRAQLKPMDTRGRGPVGLDDD